MARIIYAGILASLSLIAMSCHDDGCASVAGADDKMTITAHYADDQTARTELQSTGFIYWSVGDAVSIFRETDGAAVQFVSTAEKASVATEFEGEVVSNESCYYALYPYLAADCADYSSQTITTSLAQSQLRVVDNGGTFAQGAFPSAAMSESQSEMMFYNLCGGVQLSLAGEGVVESITITSSGGETLWGEATIDMSGAVPCISSIAAGGDSVTLDCGAGVVLDNNSYSTFTIALPPTNEGSLLNILVELAGGDSESFDVAYQVERSVVGRSDFYFEVGDAVEIYYSLADFNAAASVVPVGDVWCIDLGESNPAMGDFSNLKSTLATLSRSVDLLFVGDGYTVLPDGGAMEGATNIEEVSLIGIHTLGNGFFRSSSITRLEADDVLKKLGNESLRLCASLKEVVAGGVTELGSTMVSSETQSATFEFTVAGNMSVSSSAFNSISSRSCTIKLNKDKDGGTVTPAADAATKSWAGFEWREISFTEN